MIKPSVLLFALLISAPAWYRMLLDEVDLLQVLIRFLIAVPIAAVMLAGMRVVLSGYRKSDEAPPVRTEPLDTPEPGKTP
ncbi:hypothetical protein [Actinoplanes sp. G11-F43]|uniref:hypothetical protein n=1 Tax=Actinoplanes sp. G11-F43 TaxID=3424130 RepID=UPI003D3533BD